MIRLIFFGIVLIIAFVVWIAKQAAGHIADNQGLKDTTYKGQTQRTMDSAARGLSWLERQWDQAKSDASKEKGLASREFKDYDR
jgi:hypothetical protein